MKFEKDYSEISKKSFIDEIEYAKNILADVTFDFRTNEIITKKSKALIELIKKDTNFSVEQFLQKYSLSSEEGSAIISLAECLIRIPDEKTAFDLIDDKLSSKHWSKYVRFDRHRLLEISSVGLFILGHILDLSKRSNSVSKAFSKTVNPLILSSIKKSIEVLSKEFIIGNNIDEGIKKAKKSPRYLYSFDLLGEGSRTSEQAEIYYKQYEDAIDKISANYPSDSENIAQMPNISVKLSALFPRLELMRREEIKNILMPKLINLIKRVMEKKIIIIFDAEEARRQDIYLYILTNLIKAKEFKDYNGIGFVVQAYQKRASYIIDYILNLAKETGKKIPVRLVKGAYWDSEIKYAQENGYDDYPVFTKKEITDGNYIHIAKKMLDNPGLIFPKFATHNAQTAATILELAKDKDFEFEKLYGMGNRLFKELVKSNKVRIYSPVGKMEDLISYLLRRLIENGANTSFVNKVNNQAVDVKSLVRPISEILQKAISAEKLYDMIKPKDLYKKRENSKGMDLGYIMNSEKIINELKKYESKIYVAGSIIDGSEIISTKHSKDIFRPGNIAEKIGEISFAGSADLKHALEVSSNFSKEWEKTPVEQRSIIIKNLAQILENNKFELYSLLIREGGKTINDAISEVREAIDFCLYYSIKAEELMEEIILPGSTGEKNTLRWCPRGTFLCISPWNFPLAIFLGQIVAALVTGNTVIAKPASQTSIIANFVTKLIHIAGVPKKAMHLVIARGSSVSEILVADDRVKGIAFTGSTETAKQINMTIASRDGAIIPLIAETGGQNAMIVDSTALLEQVTDDVIASSFQSAGQRCSALRVLYVQEDIYDPLVKMISGAMEELKIGDTVDITNDVGPVIDQSAKESLEAHIKNMSSLGFNLIATHHSSGSQSSGNFFYPHIIEINNINDLKSENFGPILHVCKFKEKNLDKVIDEINNYGYGLTFGLHTRIEKKIKDVSGKIKTGNMYVNRSTIGAQVESHPFGGENKSGTGFKAGGPHYLMRFMTERAICINTAAIGGNIELLSDKK